MADATFLRTREYRDISLSFQSNPVTHDIIAVTGDEAVKRAVRNLLMTEVGEVPFFPDFGSRLSALLFEPIDPITTALLESEIRASIATYEPRVNIQTLTIVPQSEDHTYEVTMVFRVLNLSQPITLTVLLKRLR